MSTERKELTPSRGYDNQYEVLLRQKDDVPFCYNIMAPAACWIMATSFVLFSGTFPTTQMFLSDSEENAVVSEVSSVSMLVIAVLLCFSATLALLTVAFLSHNILWIKDNICLPGFANAALGLVNTLVNTWSTHPFRLRGTALSTTIVTTVFLGLFGGWYLILTLQARVYRRRQVGKDSTI